MQFTTLLTFPLLVVSALALAIPQPEANNYQLTPLERRGLGTLFTKIGANLVDKSEVWKDASQALGNRITQKSKEFERKMQGGAKCPELVDRIKNPPPSNTTPGTTIIGGAK